MRSGVSPSAYIDIFTERFVLNNALLDVDIRTMQITERLYPMTNKKITEMKTKEMKKEL
jgi:hypothetical protein